MCCFFFSSRRRHTRFDCDWSQTCALPISFFTEEVNTGMELTNVISQVLPSDSRFAGDLYADLNGEAWRAHELACARVRLAGRGAETARPIPPCDSLGDIGAPSGAVGVCMGVRSFLGGSALNGQG